MLNKHLHLLTSALESSIGVEVSTSDPNRLRQKLYKLRGEQAPLFDSLSFVIRSPDLLWIVRRTRDEND